MKKTIALITLLSLSSYALADGFTSQKYTSQYATSTAKKGPESGNVYSDTKLLSMHSVSITNSTDQVISFKYIYSLCAQDKGCIDKPFNVNVQPHQTFQDSGNLEGHVSYEHAGQYQVYARTQIIGSDRSNSDDQSSYSTIYIYKN